MTDRAAPPPIDVLLAHREWVRRFAKTLAHDDASADDLAQDAWIAAVEHPPRHVEKPAGWLRRVLVRRAIDVSVERRRRDARERVVARPEARPAAGDVVAVAESHRRVVEAVMTLDEPYRTTILLRFFEDLPPREVAARMSVPVETVRSRVRRACEQLRARLDEEHGGNRAAWLAPLIGGSAAPGDGDPFGAPPRPVRSAFGVAAAVALPAIALIAFLAHSGPDDDARTAAAAAARAAGRSERRHETSRASRRAAPPAALPQDAPEPAAPETAPSAPPVDENAPHEFVVSVVDTNRAPVAGVVIRIDPAAMKDELDATSDDRGRATFTVTGAIRAVTSLPRGSGGNAWRAVTNRVVVPAGARAIEYVVERGAWIHGRALNEDGTPYPFAGVVALDRGRTVGSTFADANGVYEVAVPPEGRWDIALTGDSHQVFSTENTPNGRVSHVMDRGRGPTDGEVRDIGSGAQGVDLVAREPVGTGDLKILVRTPDGRPLAGCPLRIDRNSWENADGTPVTDQDGRVTVPGVPNCRVAVHIALGPDDARPWEAAGCMPPAVALRVRPGLGEVVVEMRPAKLIRGRIALPDGVAWRGAEKPSPVGVHLKAGTDWISASWLDADGRFAFAVPAESKDTFRVTIRLRTPDGRSWQGDVPATPGAEDVRLELTPLPPPKPPAAQPPAEPK